MNCLKQFFKFIPGNMPMDLPKNTENLQGPRSHRLGSILSPPLQQPLRHPYKKPITIGKTKINKILSKISKKVNLAIKNRSLSS